MKRFLDVFVPLLMVCLIIFSIGWYLLEYDPDLTRDILLQQARYFDEQNNHSAAVWFYDLAYRQSDNDDAVAIELAEQYKSIGNYTKAETTLSKAIADGGTVRLYAALCKTYVEQNKLIDAVNMLNSISDPDLKAQMDALRPAAPIATPEAGKYSEYITVRLDSEGNGLYVSTDGIYPSIEEDAYSSPITLSGGETTVYALSINSDSLVSTLAVYTYTVHGVVEPVIFQDAAVEEAVRALLGYDAERPIYSNELWSVTELRLPDNIASCQDLKWFPYLEYLALEGCVVEDLSPISQLIMLQALDISNSVVSAKDLQAIAALPQLQMLGMTECQLSNISGLAGATKLTLLDLSGNAIKDLSALEGMKQLQQLNLANNALISVEKLSGLTKLQGLDVSYNSLTSTAPLASLTQLQRLDVSGNGLMALEGVDQLTELTQLEANFNNLVDINVVENCKKLTGLFVAHNTLLDIDVTAALPALVQLDFSYNEVSALPEYQVGCKLNAIDGSYNLISSLESLAGLHNLSYIYMDYNEEVSSVNELAACRLLLKVSVYGTNVTDASKLKELSVIVYYDPT